LVDYRETPGLDEASKLFYYRNERKVETVGNLDPNTDASNNDDVG
jgi:hypothetical protein